MEIDNLQITRDLDGFSCNISDTVKNVLPQYDLTEGRPLMVVDESNEFIGTLSSGDIRRAHSMYQDLLSKPVSLICNRRACYARQNDSPTTIQRLLSSNIISLPILNSERKLCAIAYCAEPSIRLGQKKITNSCNDVFLIAEVGVNHNGSLEVAKKLVAAAKSAGCDAVKFQYRTHLTYSTEDFSEQELGVQYIKKELDRCSLSYDDYETLFAYSRQLGLLVICTPFDELALELLVKMKVDVLKIASCDLTNAPLVEQASLTQLPLIISTGMSYESEILAAIKRVELRPNVSFLHCNSTYPSPIEDLNLSYIRRLSTLTRRPVGYSTHEGDILSSLVAIGCGARIIEFHITETKKQKGTDHSASIHIDGLNAFTRSLRLAASSLGDDLPRSPSQGELMNRSVLGKSLAYASNLDAGHVLSREDLQLRSPGTGFPPAEVSSVIGSCLEYPVLEGNLVKSLDLGIRAQFQTHVLGKELSDQFNCGIPVRYHDFVRLENLFKLPLYEIHMSSNDILLSPAEYISKDLLTDKKIVFHAVEQYDDGFIIDLAAEGEILYESIDRLQKLIHHVAEFREYFNLTYSIPIVVNAGGFTVDIPCSEDFSSHKTHSIARNMLKLQSANHEVVLTAQTMPPYPWHQGGRSFHNSLVTPSSIQEYIDLTNLPICIDISHTAMAANEYKFDIYKAIQDLSPFCTHYHISDASHSGQEGLQIGDGELDFKRILSILNKKNARPSLIPEIWQGHLNNGEGFSLALRRLSSYAR